MKNTLTEAEIISPLEMEEINRRQINLSHRILLFLILIISVVIRIWNINWDLPEIYEEAYPFRTAWNFWNWNGTGFDFNPHIFNYAALSFYFQFVIQVIHFGAGWIVGLYSNLQAFHQAFDQDPTSFIIMARLGSVVFDIGTIIITYYLGKLVFGKTPALLASAFISVNVLHIKESHLVNVDTPLTFFIMLSIFCIYQVYHIGSRRWYLLSGLCIGLAAATKYTGALLIPFLLIVHLIKIKPITQAVRSLTRIDILSAIGLSGVVFILLNPYIIISFKEFYERLSFLSYNVISYGHLGVVSSESTIGFYLLHSIPLHIGLPLMAAVAASIIFMLSRKQKHELILLIFPLLYLTVISLWEYRADRYLLPLFPIFMLIGSFGFVSFCDWLRKKLQRQFPEGLVQSKLFRYSWQTGLGLLLIIPMIQSVNWYQTSHSLPDTRTIAEDWIIKNVPTGIGIATTQFGMELSNDRFRILRIPYHPVMQQALVGFYKTDWYRDLDLIIGSSFDYGRYALEPEKYKEFIQFYDSLKSQCSLLQEFKPDGNQNGPTIWLYRPRPIENEIFHPELLKGLDILAETSFVVSFLEKLAFILYSKGKMLKSEQLMRTSVLIDPTNTRILKEYAWNLFQLGKLKEALMVVNRSLQLNPNKAEMIALRGSILLRSGNLNEAEENLAQALTLNDRLEIAYLDLELLYRASKNTQKAVDILTRYLKILPPESETAKLTIEHIQELKNKQKTPL